MMNAAQEAARKLAQATAAYFALPLPKEAIDLKSAAFALPQGNAAQRRVKNKALHVAAEVAAILKADAYRNESRAVDYAREDAVRAARAAGAEMRGDRLAVVHDGAVAVYGVHEDGGEWMARWDDFYSHAGPDRCFADDPLTAIRLLHDNAARDFRSLMRD